MDHTRQTHLSLLQDTSKRNHRLGATGKLGQYRQHRGIGQQERRKCYGDIDKHLVTRIIWRACMHELKRARKTDLTSVEPRGNM